MIINRANNQQWVVSKALSKQKVAKPFLLQRDICYYTNNMENSFLRNDTPDTTSE